MTEYYREKVDCHCKFSDCLPIFDEIFEQNKFHVFQLSFLELIFFGFGFMCVNLYQFKSMDLN